VYRNDETLAQAEKDVKELQRRYKDVAVQDKGRRFNTDLLEAVELGFLLDLAEILVIGARNRTESRGAQAREDYPTRDDVNWQKHTMAYREKDGDGDYKIRLDYKPVIVTRYQPTERKY
jgi:succinate dehydrogenase / fumarate reductase flavoprotein subunit